MFSPISFMFSLILFVFSFVLFIFSHFIYIQFSYLYSIALFAFSHFIYIQSCIYFQTPYLCSVSSCLYSVKSCMYSISLYIYSANFFQKQPPEKETPTQVLSCEYCELFSNIYSEEHMWTAASVFCIYKSHIPCGSLLFRAQS